MSYVLVEHFWRQQDAEEIRQIGEQKNTFQKLLLTYVVKDDIKICKQIRVILKNLQE